MIKIELDISKTNIIQFEIIKGNLKEAFLFCYYGLNKYEVFEGKIKGKIIEFEIPKGLVNIFKEKTNGFIYSNLGKIVDIEIKLVSNQVDIKLQKIVSENKNEKINNNINNKLNETLENYNKKEINKINLNKLIENGLKMLA